METAAATKITVGVLFGGHNIEHEVSFNSGRTVCNHIDTERFVVIPLYQSLEGLLYILPDRFVHRGKTTDFAHRLADEAQTVTWDDLPKLVDIIFIAMHGRFAEDGALQGLLEILGIPYCGSKVLASALGMDKVLQKKILAHAGIMTPSGVVVEGDMLEKVLSEPDPFDTFFASVSLTLHRSEKHSGRAGSRSSGGFASEPYETQVRDDTNTQKASVHAIKRAGGDTGTTTQSQQKESPPPLALSVFERSEKMYRTGAGGKSYVVKPAHEGSSLGVSIVHDEADLIPAIRKAATISPGIVQPVLVEEKIEGMEFSCIIITHPVTGEPWPLSITEIQPEVHIQFYDYEQKYMPGRSHKFTPARCSREQQELIHATCISTMHALGMTNFARIDGFLTPDNTIVIIDPNTLGGMAPASFTFLQAAQVGMSHTALINHLIDTALQQTSLKLLSHHETKVAPMLHKKIKVAVLMGGASAEREISLESGRNVTYKLSPHKYDIIPLFLTQDLHLFRLDQKLLVKNTTAEISQLLDESARVPWHSLKTVADFVFIALHGGVGENGSVQGALEFLGIPYNGSSIAASALCMDKYAANQFLKHEGFAIPEQRLITHAQFSAESRDILLREHDVKFPVIVKPHDDGCSVLVQKAVDEKTLVIALEKLFSSGRTVALVERMLTGMELTVGVLGNEQPLVLPPSYAVKVADVLSIEEKFLPGAGENQTPAPLSSEALAFVQDTIGRAYTALGCRGYARIDCFYEKTGEDQRLTILEINTLPGLTPATCIFHQAAEIGIKPMEFIDRIIELGLQAHGRPGAQAQDIERHEVEQVL